MSKYFSQGFEYSLEEVQTAADARDMGLDDYISFAGITVEEEEPIDPPKEKDPPKEEQKQQIPDWAWDAAGIVEPTKEPTKTDVIKETEAEKLLKDNTLQNQEFNMVEDAAMNNFIKASVDGKFDEWLQSPEQIEAAKQEAKAEELIQQPNIQTALINDNYTIQDIREFANLGIEGLPENGFSDSFYDDKLDSSISSYDTDSFFEESVVDQTREALKKSGIYNTFERANRELNSDKRFNYVSDIVRSDNNQITEEELPLKVNDYLISNMVETSNDRAKTYLGEETYNKWDKADAKGKNEILKNVFDSSKVTSLVDANGNFIDASRVSDQQKQKIVEKQVDEIQEYSNMGTQSLLKLFKSAEDDLASLATALVTKGEEGIFKASSIFQKGNELLGDAIPFLKDEDDKTLRSDFNDLKFMAKTGIVPKGLSYLPQGESQLVSDYNKALRKLQSIQLAVGLNVDLTKLDRQSTSDIIFEETDKALGFDEMTLGINEMQNTLLYAMQDELGFKAKEEEIARLGLRGDIYVKQPKLDDQGNIKKDEDGKIEYDAINYEMIYSTIPGFTKMSMEIGATMYLLGGASNIAKVTTGIGDLAAVGMSRFFSPGVAAQFGKFTGGVLQESVGLVGSNAISSNIFGGKEMPVLSFAAGSQLGHLGIGFLGKVIPKGISRYATENRAFGNVVDFVNKIPFGSTIGGAIKFTSRPVIGTTAIKAGEFTSGLVDLARGEGQYDNMSELWHHVTDADSFIETYGALLFMSAAHPTQLMNKAVDNFQYDILKLRTDMPSWNRLASEIGLEARGFKKGGPTSWTRAEINKAVNERSNEIATNPELAPEQAREQLANVKAIGKRLGIKRQIDIQSEKASNISNWNTTYTNLQRTINSIKAGNKINATDIKNLTDAGIANGGASPVLELQTAGLNNTTATEVYKFSKNSYNEAQQFFKDANSKNFKNYIESGLQGFEAQQAKANLKSELEQGNINQAAYNIQLKEVQEKIDLETARQEVLIDVAKGDTEARIKETIDYSEQVKAEGSEIRELGNNAFINLKAKLTGKISNSIGYGFQTTINGKPVFVINKDAMAPSKGEYRFTSGGKEYIVKGFQGSTLKHEIFHPVFENKFSSKSVEQRARKLAGAEGDIDAARETIIKQDIEYIDQFKERLRELGVFNRVEQEMKKRPGYNELIKNDERSVEIEKEFINEFLELQNEGVLNSLVEGTKFKNVSADVITELKNGADVVDYFFTGVEQTPEGKAKVKQAQEAYKELVKDGDVTLQTSEKNLKSLAKEYKENPNEISLEKVEDLIQQYTASGIDALKRAANRGQRKVPVNTKDPNVTSGIADLLVLEFDSFTRNYDPTKGEPSTYMNLIAERILPKYIEKFKPKETTRIDDLTKDIADTKTPETELTDKESATRETERLVSVFEGKEAKAKEKEIIEVFGDLRSDAKKLQEARLKGFGGTPKEELSKVAELLFNVPDGTKVSNPSKNVLPTINIVDSKGKKISTKRLKAGEKGIIEAKDFLSLRDYFKDKNNLRRFLNVSLPEYNVNTPQAIVNTKGEIIEVSPDVVGRGIRLPDRIYDYFYEQFIDPTGVMTSPSGRGKGKTSQVPKVYKIKPEFRKPSNEVIEKVSKDILADLKLSELPEAYNRNMAQLVKGMALVETMAVANQAKRAKLPVETAAEKQLIADIKSSSSKLSMSEKLLPKKRKTQVAKMTDLMGAYDFYNPESVTKARNVILGDYAKIFGPGLLSRMFRDLTPGGGRGEKVIGKQMAIGSFEALDSTKKTYKKMVDDLVEKGKTRAEATKEVSEKKNLEQQYLGNNQTLIENNLILDISNLKSNIEQQGLKDNPAAKIMLEAFGKGQKLNKLASNLANLKTRKKATELLIEKFKEAYDANPEAAEVLREFIYNSKASGMLGKDVALMRGNHVDAKEGKKVYEEHIYPFSSWAIRTMDAITNKNPKVLEGWKKWAAENYYQIAFDMKDVIEVSDGKFLIYQAAVDQTFKRADGKGEFDSKSGEHPFLEQALNEAFKTGDFSKVPASEIRFFNEYVQLNPNKLSLDGKTYAEKYNVTVDKFLENNPAIIKAQSDLIFKQLTTDLTAKEARERLDKIIKVEGTKEADAAFKETKTDLDASGVMNTSEKMTTDKLVEKAKMIDKALQMADRPNAPVKKIRIFDFDDTLAKTQSVVYYDRPNQTGKPVPRNKAIFMIGGPGSGKTNIGKGLQLGREGWKVVNQDIFIEAEKSKAGLPESEREYNKEQRSLRAKIGAAGVKAAKAKLDKYTEAGDGMVIDGTGASYNATMKKVQALKDQGYEVFMVHAKTSPEAAVSRNKARKERSLPTFVVERTQKSVAENIDKYRKDFGEKFMEIDTETIEYGKPLPDAFIGQVKAKVYANERGRLSAEEFAEQGQRLVEQGYEMDFTDFNRVREGEKGPLFGVAETIKKARGNEDLYVLTARAPESQKAIYEFLKQQGLEFKEDNIVGLGNSTGEAKANWIIDKAAEGFNDFYFADDAIQNVKAVKTALSVIDVKSKVQQARLNTSEKMNAEFNNIIEQSSGIDASKVFSDVKAELRGGKKKGQRFFIPPSAEDFQGLLYVTLPKGIKGEKAYKFYQDALLDPYTRAMTNLSTSRVNIMSDFKTLKKELDVPKDLKKETASGFTNEQAVRVYLWNQLGEKIPGLSKTDLKELTDIVNADPKLSVFADQILRITKGDGYSTPSKGWANGTITTDLLEVLNKTKRTKYLKTWQENVDVIFSTENLNKLEAAYGTKYRQAVQNSLARMKTGSNRVAGGNRLSNQVLDYINNSTGVTMFLNARSALLQTISSANYINWSFNNPYKAGKAFANQPQFWKDFKMLINSDYLKDRRNGLKLNVSESEIANAAKTGKNKAKAVLSYLLEKGYAPTKYADSFAIAFGGASYYRNRVKDLMKNQSLSEVEASERALKEWRAESEKSQQSADPSKISAQQSSDLGRVVLQYVNTPMQYARLQKRDIQDIANKRRMPGKTLAESNRVRVSRVIYYAAIQNLIFNAMQQGLFALGFGDTDISDDEQKKIIKGANGMLDSSLRGLGFAGVTVQVLKNLGIDIYERSQKNRPEYVDAWIKLLEFSPAIKSKLGRFKSAAYPFDNKQKREEVFEKGFALNNPAYESAAKVITATTNIPLDRVMSKTNNLVRAFDDDVEAWMSVAMIMGWPEWQLTDKGDDNTSENVFGNKSFKGSSNNPFAKAAKKSKNKNPFAK